MQTNQETNIKYAMLVANFSMAKTHYQKAFGTTLDHDQMIAVFQMIQDALDGKVSAEVMEDTANMMEKSVGEMAARISAASTVAA